MRKWTILAVVLGTLAGAVALALVNLDSYLNRNKDWLAGQVESAVGRKVSFSEIGVRLIGGFGARIRDLRIADDAAFSKEDFVRAGDVQVSVRLWPALFGRYEVSRVVLSAPEVTIIRTRDGFNYDSIGKPRGAPPKPATAATPDLPPAARAPASTPGAGEQAAFLVSLVEIEKGQFRYLDRTTTPPGELRLRDLDFSASDVSLDRPIHLKLAAALFGAGEQNVELEGSLGPLGSPPNVKGAALDLSIDAGSLVVDDMKKLQAVAKALPAELSSADPVSLSAKVSGSLDRPKLAADLDGSGAAIRYGAAFQKPKGVALKLQVSVERAGNALDVKRLALRIAELDLAGHGVVDSSPGGALDFQIDSKKTPLAGWDKLLPAFAGHEVSGSVEVHVRAQGKTGGRREAPQLFGTVALEGVAAKRAGSPYEIEDLTTRVELKGASASIPPTAFRLSGSPVEVQAEVPSFRPLTATFRLGSAQLSAASLNFASPTVEKPEVLRGLDLRGQLRVAGNGPEFQGTLRSSDGSLRNFDYRDLSADLNLRDRVATIDKLALRAFDGTYDGSGRYDMREAENPKFDFRSSLRGMDLKSLLASQSPGSEKKIEGQLDADLSLGGAGKGWEAIRRQLRGNGRLDVRDGVLKDVNIADQVLQSVTGIAGLSNLISPRVRRRHPSLFGTGDTRFDKLGAGVRIADGIAHSDDLTLAARDYAMLGEGTFSLDNRLDCTARLIASKELSADVIADVREAKYIANPQGKIEIPFRLTGELPHVKPKPDADFIGKALGRAFVGKGLEKLLGKDKPLPPGVTPTPDLKHPERELLRKGLEGLFGR
ncbi:MAG: AsmA family protein [Deltaproteobacteria bacterium]|nr:AsmA family protein [Deltaproteobacteria bacterium]